MIIFILITILPVVNLIITIYNFFTAPKLMLRKLKHQNLKVSVLIPARNEERNVENCLIHVQRQSYKNLEIIVLDDLSKDSTSNKAECLSYEDNRIKVIKGKELPDGWLGKNWACKQLSEIASGDYLLFIDADVSLENNAIESALFEIENTNSDMLSVFPNQILKTIGEKITVPIINWLMISFLPIVNVRKSSRNYYAAANGQFMLWRNEVYFQSGGHDIVKDKIVEDIEIARLLKINKYKINLLLPGKLISCRMYNSFSEGINGFTKNFFPASGITGWQFILILTLIVFVYLFPLIAVFRNTLYLSTISLIILQRVFVSILSNQNILVNIVLYPLQMITMFYISIKSVIAIKGSGVYWKDRKL